VHKLYRLIIALLLNVCLSGLVAVLAVPASVMSPAMAQAGPTNLLVNGDFEAWDWNSPGWPYQDGIPEVQVAPGWRAYYVDNAPQGVSMPENWKRPEFRDVKSSEYSYRVRSGLLAQKYFTFGGQHIAGLYQQVGNITPGTQLRFTIYMQTWSCMPSATAWNICPTGHGSNSPSPMHTRVGIDPVGGTNPWAPTVVWSPEINAYDQWTQFQVEAVAAASTVTVFTYSYPDWFDDVFRVHNDVYVDDGSLIALNEVPVAATPVPTEEVATPQPTNTPDPSQPTPTPADTATPAPTPTARPDGATIHVVKEGDSLLAIALQYNVTMDKLQELNALANVNFLSIGQELVVATLGSTAPAPEAGAAVPEAGAADPEAGAADPEAGAAAPLSPTATLEPRGPIPTTTSAPVQTDPVPLPTPTATLSATTDARVETITEKRGSGWTAVLIAATVVVALAAAGVVVSRRLR
jgi:LysM repeat protein